MLFQFKTAEDLEQWEAYADSQMGGRSTAELQLSEECPVSSAGAARWLAASPLPARTAPNTASPRAMPSFAVKSTCLRPFPLCC